MFFVTCNQVNIGNSDYIHLVTHVVPSVGRLHLLVPLPLTWPLSIDFALLASFLILCLLIW